jgi:hypothetical protein
MARTPGGSPPVSASDRHDALVASLVELERHVGEAGWEQPPRLFALVPTDALAAAEPALARTLGLRTTAEGGSPGALTAIEQEDFSAGHDLVADLAAVVWPESVFGCAVATVRTFLPASAEVELPDDPAAAAELVAAHPQRQEIRVVVGADRGAQRHGVARVRSQPDELLGGQDLVPGLAAALAHTLA